MLPIHEIKNLILKAQAVGDIRCINIETGRKITWNARHEKQFFFDHERQICCPLARKSQLTQVVAKLSVKQKRVLTDPNNHFDWASDVSEDEVIPYHTDYIVEEIVY
jgi:hypothetical protein